MAPPHTAILRSLVICVASRAAHWTIQRARIRLTNTQFFSQALADVGFAVVKIFGDFAFDDRRRALRARGKPVRLSGQAVDLLCLLLERPGELITREEIASRLWPHTHVNVDHGLDVVVSRLRKVLGDKDPPPRFIETVPRRGYRFIEPDRQNAPRVPVRMKKTCTRGVLRTMPPYPAACPSELVMAPVPLPAC